MKLLIPKILRFLINPLINKKITYLPAMVLVRFSRKLRHKYYQSGEEMCLVNNCMGSIKMRVDKNSYMGGSIYWSGYHHVNEMLYLNSYLEAEMTFIDIGANQGEFSLFAASKLTSGRVISFEPVNKQYNYFVTNIQLNNFKNIELNHYGLSNEIGQLPIYTSNNSVLHGGVHEGLSTLYQSGDRVEYEQTVDLKVFDDVYKDKLSRLDFIKIDIEGAELFALKGMKKHIEKFKPDILIEMNNDTFSSAGYTMKDVTDFLFEFHYKPYKIHRGLLSAHSGNFSDWGNYIFKSII